MASINLTNNKIGDDGAKAIAEMLKINKTLALVNLSYNGIGFEGAKAIVESLLNNKVITNCGIVPLEYLDLVNWIIKTNHTIFNQQEADKVLVGLAQREVTSMLKYLI